MKDKPEIFDIGKGEFAFDLEPDEKGRTPQKAVIRHPHITCPRCREYFKSGGTDKKGRLYYICGRCKHKWYEDEKEEKEK